jgi:hypothetical protein
VHGCVDALPSEEPSVDARVADILSSERKTTNGSTEKQKPPIVLHEAGEQRERQRADAERIEGLANLRPWPHTGE